MYSIKSIPKSTQAWVLFVCDFIKNGRKSKMDLQTTKDLLQILLQVANIVIIGYGLYKFMNKPHDTLEERVKDLEKRADKHDLKFDEVEKSLHEGNDNFREQAETNEVLIRSTFALLEFEVHYCETEQKPITKNLEKAKDDLHAFLAKR